MTKKTILTVEDHDLLLFAIRDILKAELQCGYGGRWR